MPCGGVVTFTRERERERSSDRGNLITKTKHLRFNTVMVSLYGQNSNISLKLKCLLKLFFYYYSYFDCHQVTLSSLTRRITLPWKCKCKPHWFHQRGWKWLLPPEIWQFFDWFFMSDEPCKCYRWLCTVMFAKQPQASRTLLQSSTLLSSLQKNYGDS